MFIYLPPPTFPVHLLTLELILLALLLTFSTYLIYPSP